MAIVSSVIASQDVQRDGRIWVIERHTDQYGAMHERFYLALAGTDLNAALTAYAAIIDAVLTQQEIDANIADVATNGSLATPSLRYSTAAQNLAQLRSAFRDMTDRQAVMTGDYLNTATDQQLMAAFGLTQAQVTALRANKLQPAAALANSIRNATGA
jgi:hypothetical protein